MKWSTEADLKSQVMKWWQSGEILSALVTEKNIFPKRLKFSKPTSAEIANCFDEVRSWVAKVKQIRHCRFEMQEFRHRIVGRNSMPQEAWIDCPDDALSFIGKTSDCKRFEAILRITAEQHPQLLSWLAAKPLRALALHDDWERILKVVSWIQKHHLPNIYIRQVDIPGLDTKFVEKYSSVLAELFDLSLPPEVINTTARPSNLFSRRYGFREKPFRIRFRILDPEKNILPGNCLQDITLDKQSFSEIKPKISRVFITENEVNFLSLEQVRDSMVIFGAGYSIEELSCANWLLDCCLYYWGDIDTHGFAILGAARSRFPHIQSLLMDERTLLDHCYLWGFEESQHPTSVLPHLHEAEQNVYRHLKQHTWGQNIRLEQERINWSYACEAIAKAL